MPKRPPIVRYKPPRETAVLKSYETRENEFSKFYKSRRWKRLRAWYIAQHPICEICNERLATEVDHIVELRDGGSPTALDNLQALCHRCHSKKTMKERARREGKLDV